MYSVDWADELDELAPRVLECPHRIQGWGWLNWACTGAAMIAAVARPMTTALLHVHRRDDDGSLPPDKGVRVRGLDLPMWTIGGVGIILRSHC